jgi:AcrR family transcriptional regulator
MNQQERSERSRSLIRATALRLFSHQGFRGTSMRDIAEAAKVSTGAVYHQFPDKESLFRALLDDYFRAIESPDFPFNRALAAGAFPDDLEALGRAARDTVRQFRAYITLIYVDVIEFEGSHIRKFYSDMAKRFDAWVQQHPDRDAITRKLRPGVAPGSAVMLVSRLLLHYYATEIVFGVPNHFGKDSDAVLRDIADILRHGMLRPAARPVVKRARALRAASRS